MGYFVLFSHFVLYITIWSTFRTSLLLKVPKRNNYLELEKFLDKQLRIKISDNNFE